MSSEIKEFSKKKNRAVIEKLVGNDIVNIIFEFMQFSELLTYIDIDSKLFNNIVQKRFVYRMENETKVSRIDNLFHSKNDIPSIENDQCKAWHRYGLLHRTGGPALIINYHNIDDVCKYHLGLIIEKTRSFNASVRKTLYYYGLEFSFDDSVVYGIPVPIAVLKQIRNFRHSSPEELFEKINAIVPGTISKDMIWRHQKVVTITKEILFHLQRMDLHKVILKDDPLMPSFKMYVSNEGDSVYGCVSFRSHYIPGNWAIHSIDTACGRVIRISQSGSIINDN